MLVLIGNTDATAHWQTIKGVVFIAVTSALLYRLIAAYALALSEQSAEREVERRMSSLGQLASKVAHEFRNVLMGCGPFVELIDAQRVAGILPTETAIAHLQNSIARGQHLCSDILRFGRPSPADVHDLELRPWLLHFAEGILPRVAPTTISILAPELLAVRADAQLLYQALTNLVVNAREAGASRVTISASGGEHLWHGGVTIAVEDDGTGIPPQILPRLFEPLVTSKKGGSGLGLAIAYQCVHAQGGSITVERTGIDGTRFCIDLPRQMMPAS